jgi:hypothetical protein
MKDWLIALLHPSTWMQIFPYSAEWDAKLKTLLSENTFENIGEYQASLGGYQIWITNYPYGAFHPRDLGIRAKRATILYTRKRLIHDIIEGAK